MNPSIITHTYELLKYALTSSINLFPRTYKYTLGKRIQELLQEILELFIEAYFTSKQKEDKTTLLQKANIKLEILRHYIRLSYDVELINAKKYEFISKKINEIGKELGGWLKSI
jgi:hypothetical protein